jgi:hypothetical protein
MDLWTLGFFAWLTKKLWTPKPTHQLLGLPRPIAGRVLDALDSIESDTPPEILGQIHADARETFWMCLRERSVPEDVYDLVIRDPISGHRVRRRTDDLSWSLAEFDDFIDLGLNPQGTRDD